MAREASAEGVSSREKDEVSEKERARRFTCLLCFRGARHLSLLRPPNPPSHNAGPLARTSDRRPATAQHQALAGVGRAGGADAGGEGYVGGGKKRRACVTGRGGGLLRQCSSNAPSARALAHSPAPAQPSSLRPTATRAAPRSHWRTYGEKTERERARRDVRAEKKNSRLARTLPALTLTTPSSSPTGTPWSCGARSAWKCPSPWAPMER